MTANVENQRDGASPPPRFAITVEFELQQGASERFLQLVQENASISVRDEPGCFRFDLLTTNGDERAVHRVLLYEIYADRAAFESHVNTPHFAAFDDATRSLVRRKTVAEFDVHENAKRSPTDQED